ncbi:6-phosphogluconolactonase [Inmirania thermothiophila]|uniref:6-phosphogluconolactonase n=1 Tax=Inmirania thermothiophila TaxID=1750597 RepID=A0A3N1Y770_9GAMM|nr:6-phosphogluconolactonase [Inmirania thermothiophila]ROR34663.1 6-phosphogluconolactonase [Inmirania thermothiophila]
MPPQIRILDDPETLAEAAAARCEEILRRAVATAGTAHLALAGGRTPRALYRRLARRGGIDWRRVHVWFGDERAVPFDDPRSNYRMARETLLEHVPVPPAQVHPMRARPPCLRDDAEAYAATLCALAPLSALGVPCLDLVLLGLGADGHVASLFPGTRALAERDDPVAAVDEPGIEPPRLTLTLPVLDHARHLLLLVAGEEKAAVVRRALAEAPRGEPLPVQRLAPRGTLEWFLDAAAAAGVPREGA